MFYTRFCMQNQPKRSWIVWAGALLSTALLELPFPVAGPMPAWRAVFAWFGLAPLLCALLSRPVVESKRPRRFAFLLGYLCGALWYMGNCYWVYDTILIHGGLPPLVSAVLFVCIALVLGLYWGAFGLAVLLVRQRTGSVRLALLSAPFFWTALELAASRITSVPWDQLGYSQIDNQMVNQLAPWTGVYGISFLLVFASALIAGGKLLPRPEGKKSREWRIWALAGVALMAVGSLGLTLTPPAQPTSATAVLVQPNLDVEAENIWNRPGEWKQHMDGFAQFAGNVCKSYLAGVPETGAALQKPFCAAAHPDLVVWPEAPAPFFESDPRFQRSMADVAGYAQAPLVIGGIGVSPPAAGGSLERAYNSAMVFAANGQEVGRQDKIHLVPFGEYIPFKEFLPFAHKLTGRVAEFNRGEERRVFRLGGHRYGIFICYEAVFADEVRQLVELGAESLVNISDDGWYGDTSAPWEHLNMARMRAIENRRWILRDTNNGATVVIDPNGRVLQSIPRHAVDALPAAYGFRSDLTFYTVHGDVFGWLCVIIAVLLLFPSLRSVFRLPHGGTRK